MKLCCPSGPVCLFSFIKLIKISLINISSPKLHSAPLNRPLLALFPDPPHHKVFSWGDSGLNEWGTGKNKSRPLSKSSTILPGSRLDSSLLTRAPHCALSSRAGVGVYVRPEPHSSTAGITGATWHQLFISQLLQLADGGTGLKELRVVVGKESEGFSVAKSLAPCLLTQQTLEEERLTLLEVYSSGALISQQRRHWQLVFTFVC